MPKQAMYGSTAGRATAFPFSGAAEKLEDSTTTRDIHEYIGTAARPLGSSRWQQNATAECLRKEENKDT
jgi:hypothetical protein